MNGECLPSTMPLNAKQAGASYEAQFTADALKRGLNVLQPFGDYLPYDLIVENKRAETFRVQVKGTTHKQKGKNNAYRTTAASGNHRIGKNKITPDKADVLALYVAPVNVWYHIPVEKGAAATVTVRPVTESSGQYEVWKNAWNTYF